jgi:hypothetical protein
MVDKRLIEYIEGELKDGNSLENIKQRLLDSGWPLEDVEKAIDIVPLAPKRDIKPFKESKKSRKWLWGLIMLVILIIIVFVSPIGYYISMISYFQWGTREIKISEGYCIGTTANVIIKNVGTGIINLGKCSGPEKTKNCGDIEITRIAGRGLFEPTFNSTVIQPGGTIGFKDSGCTLGGIGYICRYKFSIKGTNISFSSSIPCAG